jgi:N-acetylmuramoyl-L-alanine amidase
MGSLSRRRLLQLGAASAAALALRPDTTFAQQAPPQPTPQAAFDWDVGLDPGHTRIDVGASGAGVGEYQHTLDIAVRNKPLLEANGLRVKLTRTDHEPVSQSDLPGWPDERAKIEQFARVASVGKVQAYVSIHFTAGPAGVTSLRGTETYYNPENAGEQSYRLADSLQRNVVFALTSFGYPTLDRGVKIDLQAGKSYGHFYGLRGGFPSCLVEGLFLSNPTEAALLLHEEARQALALGYAQGIIEYFLTRPA